jgi:ABC-type Mn2+/Zn2+ transport system ATPase subunit
MNHTHEHHHAPRDLEKRSLDPNPDWIFPVNASAEKVVEWDHVSLNFGGRRVLSELSAFAYQNELTCICGANGAGKTQLLRVTMGVVAPCQGRVQLLGDTPAKTRKNVGYVPQLKAFNRSYPASVEDVLVAALRGEWPLKVSSGERSMAADSLSKVGGVSLLDKIVGDLSGGEVQRVFMARALMGKPAMIVMDEPMAAVDHKGRHAMLDLLFNLRSQGGVSVLLITHSEQLVSEIADRIMFLDKGRLVGWGTPAEVLKIDALRDLAFAGHDHEAEIHSVEEG